MPVSTATGAFTLADVSVAFDGDAVLRHVDLQIECGEFIAILGENGSGKSTLIRAMLGLVPVSSGRVLAHGIPIDSLRDWHRIAYVPQRLLSAGAVPVSVEEVVAAACFTPDRRLRRDGSSRRARVTSALASVGLDHRRRDRVDALSGGQQRRVLIAAALAKGADVFILDEPTAGVDAETQARIAETFRSLRDSGSTVILVTHELGEFADLSSRILVLDRAGRQSIRYDGPPPVPEGLRDHVWHHSEDVVARPASMTPLLEPER